MWVLTCFELITLIHHFDLWIQKQSATFVIFWLVDINSRMCEGRRPNCTLELCVNIKNENWSYSHACLVESLTSLEIDCYSTKCRITSYHAFNSNPFLKYITYLFALLKFHFHTWRWGKFVPDWLILLDMQTPEECHLHHLYVLPAVLLWHHWTTVNFPCKKIKPPFHPQLRQDIIIKVTIGRGPLWTLKSQDFNGQNAIFEHLQLNAGSCFISLKKYNVFDNWLTNYLTQY